MPLLWVLVFCMHAGGQHGLQTAVTLALMLTMNAYAGAHAHECMVGMPGFLVNLHLFCMY